MYRAYKFRLYPNDEQKLIINKTFGCMRKVYNYYLGKCIETRKLTKRIMNKEECISDYKNNLIKEFPYLQEIEMSSIRKSIDNLYDAYNKYLNGTKNHPRFKNRFSKCAYTIGNISVNMKEKTMKSSNLGLLIIRGYKKLNEIDGRIINCTISKEPTGKYYASILVSMKNPIKKEKLENIVGIDMGIKTLMTLSDGITYENNKHLEKYEKRIKQKQKELSRKVKNSNNYMKCKRKIEVLYSKLRNSRKYYTHIVTRRIVNEYDIICTETLSIINMLKSKQSIVNKSILDSTIGEIIRQLKYKSEWAGERMYQVDRYYKSSQECSVCNNINKEMKDLNNRQYICIKCNNIIDRDLNASINIMFEGMKKHLSQI